MNKFIKVLILNLMIVAVMIVCYSDGFLALRPSDPSIFRAGMAIFMVLFGAAVFVCGNYVLLKGPQRHPVELSDLKDLSQARHILSAYHGGKYFGHLADTTSNQLDRLKLTMDRAQKSINMKFEPGSMSYDRYASSVIAAQEAALSNTVAMANRMQLFDESEYERLQHYKEDDIPDDIQEKQIELYRENLNHIEQAVAANERLILALDTMSVELTKPGEEEKDEALLSEIEKLTEQVSYYRN